MSVSAGNAVLVTGGNFLNNTNVNFEGLTGLETLRQNSTLDALFDSRERFDPPKCHPRTRITLIRRIMAWILAKGAGRPAVMWIRGPAGVGKTALEQTIAEICRRKGNLASSFFFARTSIGPNDGKSFIATIAYQLADSFPHVRSHIERVVKRDPSILTRSNESQMRALIINPLNNIRSLLGFHLGRLINPQPFVIIIDGLDECSDRLVQCDILTTIATAVEELKLPIKFLIASRPEAHIMRTMMDSRLRERMCLSDIDLTLDADADADIRLFLVEEFKHIKAAHPLHAYFPASWPPEASLTQLVKKASGQFIYASTVIKYIQSPRHRPDDRLDIVLGLSLPPTDDEPFAQLDALYSHIFTSAKENKTLLIILSILVIQREARDHLGEYGTPAMIDKLVPSFKPGDVHLLLNDFRCIVGFGGPNEPIVLLHASLRDFLCESSRSGSMYVDVKMAHTVLARGYLKLIASMDHIDPWTLKHYVIPFLNHSAKGYPTVELQEDLFKLDIISFYRSTFVHPINRKVTGILYAWFILGSFFSLLSGQLVMNSALREHHLTRLEAYLTRQLKETTLVDRKLVQSLVALIESPSSTSYAASQSDVLDDNLWKDPRLRKIRWLSILCQLFPNHEGVTNDSTSDFRDQDRYDLATFHLLWCFFTFIKRNAITYTTGLQIHPGLEQQGTFGTGLEETILRAAALLLSRVESDGAPNLKCLQDVLQVHRGDIVTFVKSLPDTECEENEITFRRLLHNNST